MEEEVFAAEPPGFKTNDNEKGLLVMKLRKSLYGLAQSPGSWFLTIDPVLISIGFVPLKSDTCINIYNYHRVIIILSFYVDDLLVIGGDIQLCYGNVGACPCTGQCSVVLLLCVS